MAVEAGADFRQSSCVPLGTAWAEPARRKMERGLGNLVDVRYRLRTGLMNDNLVEVYWDARFLLSKQEATGFTSVPVDCLRLFRAIRNIVADQFPEYQTDTRIRSRGRGDIQAIRVRRGGHDVVGAEVDALVARIDAAVGCYRNGYFGPAGGGVKLAM